LKSILLFLFFSIILSANSFKIVKFEELDNSFLAIREFSNGGSCCTYIHIFKTKPRLEKIYTHNSDVMKFISKNIIIRYEDKKGIDLSDYPLCCRPKDKFEIDLNKFIEGD